MSLKSVEMQIALPRTVDAGKLQEQMQNRGMLQNDAAANLVKKEDEQKQKTVVKQERKDIVRFHKEGENNNESDQKREKRDKNQEKQGAQHPYKGKILDYSG